jgi:hypothetical protein
MLSPKLWCASEVFLFILFTFLSLLELYWRKEERKKTKKQKRKERDHRGTPVLLKISGRDECNVINEDHQR